MPACPGCDQQCISQNALGCNRLSDQESHAELQLMPALVYGHYHQRGLKFHQRMHCMHGLHHCELSSCANQLWHPGQVTPDVGDCVIFGPDDVWSVSVGVGLGPQLLLGKAVGRALLCRFPVRMHIQTIEIVPAKQHHYLESCRIFSC